MSRKQLSKSDIKKLLDENKYLEKFISKKSNLAMDDNFLLIDNKPLFFTFENKIIPTLPILLKDITTLPQVIVDKGAIKFVVNGADIMRPGIIGCDDFEKDSFVVIIEETYKKPLAVGQVLFNSKDLLEKKEGKVIKNIHFIGDLIWEKCK
jgi:PUA-domain protein